jgi:hypothetical protein
MRKHYIHINNCINNFSRQAITPKIGNAYYNKLNNYITPTSTINKSNKHKNNILITKKNFNNFNYNNNKYILENDNCHNKNSSLNNYSNILNLISKQNTNIKKNENKNKDEVNKIDKAGELYNKQIKKFTEGKKDNLDLTYRPKKYLVNYITSHICGKRKNKRILIIKASKNEKPSYLNTLKKSKDNYYKKENDND